MTKKLLTLASALLLVSACDLDLEVPNLNQLSAGGAATRSTVIAGAQGLINQARGISTGMGTFNIWGRESYTLAPEEPRPLTDNLIGPRDPNSSGAGAGFNYGAIVNVRALLQSVDVVTTMSEAEKEAVRGWAKTIAGFAYAQTAMVYPEFGAPLEPPENPTGELSEVATGPQLYDRAIQLLDEAYAHLQKGGATFPFSLTAGYAGFNTPANFGKLNRALKARVLKYKGDFAGVLTALQQSFIDPNGDLTVGVYHYYFAQDNSFNPLFQPRTTYIHPRILANAQLKANGAKDNRAVSKTIAVTSFTLAGITVTEKPNMFPTNVSPFPWITNEELLLLRAEARLGTNDPTGALADVNIVRTKSGGLDAVSGLTGEALRTEILYNKLYSLLMLGGFSYFDAKQYNRLTQLPKSLPSHVIFDRMNWPAGECTARAKTDGPCGPVDGR
jgi:starch-binding outer membrane protein, SusD/RagB family